MANQKQSSDRLSLTAFLIPKVIPALARSRRYKSLVTREQIKLSKRFTSECAKHSASFKIIHRLFPAQAAASILDAIAIKGLPVHYASRKKYIREKLDSVIADVKQVVVLGAGFDTLALEYCAKHPKVKFFEVDLPSTQNIKLSAIKKIPQYENTPNLSFIASDLSVTHLEEVLLEAGFDKKAKTFFVIEGVLMYLTKGDVEKLFQEISSITPKGSFLVAGSMSELESKGNARAKVSDVALKVKKEKYNFAESPAEIKKMLGRAGLELAETKLYHELQAEFENGRRMQKIQAERGEHYYFAQK